MAGTSGGPRTCEGCPCCAQRLYLDMPRIMSPHSSFVNVPCVVEEQSHTARLTGGAAVLMS